MKKQSFCDYCGADLTTPRTPFQGETGTCGSSRCREKAWKFERQYREDGREQLGLDFESWRPQRHLRSSRLP